MPQVVNCFYLNVTTIMRFEFETLSIENICHLFEKVRN